jgi:hypothetical protein
MAVLLWLDPDQGNYRSATEQQLIGTVEAGRLSGLLTVGGRAARHRLATLRTGSWLQ